MRAVEDQTDLSFRYEKNNDQFEADFQIAVQYPEVDKKEINYLVEVKTQISNSMIGSIALQIKSYDARCILVTRYVTQNQAEKLRELDILFLDTAGNAYLKDKGFYILIHGNRKPNTAKEKTLGLFNPVGMKLLFNLLINPGLENASYRTIAEETDVPKTTVGRFINELDEAGYLISRSNNKRLLIRKDELIKRWAEAYAEKLRIKLKPVRYHSTKYDGRWWENIEISEHKAVWGGETGGAILTKHLKPENATIYANSKLPKLQLKYGLVQDKKGEIEILQKFWNFGEVENTAPPLVVYADLLATADERNIETAQIIYDEYLAQIAEENS